jgi:hypothetical protein
MSPAGIARRHVIGRVSFIVASRNSDLNSGALETAEQSKGMQRYHEFCLKSALKVLILGWVVVVEGFQGRRKSTRAIR